MNKQKNKRPLTWHAPDWNHFRSPQDNLLKTISLKDTWSLSFVPSWRCLIVRKRKTLLLQKGRHFVHFPFSVPNLVSRASHLTAQPRSQGPISIFSSEKSTAKSSAKANQCQIQAQCMLDKVNRSTFLLTVFFFFKEWPDLTLIDKWFLCFIPVCLFSESAHLSKVFAPLFRTCAKSTDIFARASEIRKDR